MSVFPQGMPPSYQEAQLLTQAEIIASTSNSTVQEGQSSGDISGQLPDVNDANVEKDKRAIYMHPLFPLMALLFEKCERCTLVPDSSVSDNLDADIQAFVQHQESDRKPIFSDDTDLDSMMVHAIQVLRIHMLELDKVNDLCKDFCNRYITCLKGKLQSENLLRIDSGYESPDYQGGSQGQVPGQIQMQQVVNPLTGNNVIIQQGVSQGTVPMTQLGQSQIVSGGTVYQMVQTAQGIVAQPIQIQATSLQTQVATTGPIIQGTTPLSHVGVVGTPVAAQQQTLSVPSQIPLSPCSDSDDDSFSSKRKNKRGVLPKSATQVMRSWLFQHIVHPYPTEDEKRQIAVQTNLSLLQVNNWFINARRRILQPMLDASNPEQVRVKKAKPQNKPVQRFWPESIANLQPQLPGQTSGEDDPVDRQSERVKEEEKQQAVMPAVSESLVASQGQILKTMAVNMPSMYVQQNPTSQSELQVMHNGMIETLRNNTKNNSQLDSKEGLKENCLILESSDSSTLPD